MSDSGVLVYNHNEVTKKTSDVPLKHVSKNRSWIYGMLSLSSKLPIDTIYFFHSTSDNEDGTKDLKLDVEFSSVQKIPVDESTEDTTRVVDQKSIFSTTRDLDPNAYENSGMLQSGTCTPSVSTQKANKKSKVPWLFNTNF